MRKRYIKKEAQPREFKDKIHEDVQVYNKYGACWDFLRYLRQPK